MLGCYRNNSIIPWDDDMDLGIEHKYKTCFENPKFKKIAKKLNIIFYDSSPKSKSNPFTLRNSNTIHSTRFNADANNRTIFHIKNATKRPALEIIWYYKKNKDFYDILPGWKSPRWIKSEINATHLFPLIEYRFGPLKILGPNNIEKYCKDIYNKIDISKITHVHSGGLVGRRFNFIKKYNLGTIKKKEFIYYTPSNLKIINNRTLVVDLFDNYTLTN